MVIKERVGVGHLCGMKTLIENKPGNIVQEDLKKTDGIVYQVTKWYDEEFFYKKLIIHHPGLPEPLEFMEKVARINMK